MDNIAAAEWLWIDTTDVTWGESERGSEEGSESWTGEQGGEWWATEGGKGWSWPGNGGEVEQTKGPWVRVSNMPVGICAPALALSVTIYFSLFLSYSHPASFDLITTLSPRHLVTLSPHYLATSSPYLLITLSPSHPVFSSSSSSLSSSKSSSHLLSSYTPVHSLSWTLYDSLSLVPDSLDLYLDPRVSPVLFLSSPSSLQTPSFPFRTYLHMLPHLRPCVLCLLISPRTPISGFSNIPLSLFPFLYLHCLVRA